MILVRNSKTTKFMKNAIYFLVIFANTSLLGQKISSQFGLGIRDNGYNLNNNLGNMSYDKERGNFFGNWQVNFHKNEKLFYSLGITLNQFGAATNVSGINANEVLSRQYMLGFSQSINWSAIKFKKSQIEFVAGNQILFSKPKSETVSVGTPNNETSGVNSVNLYKSENTKTNNFMNFLPNIGLNYVLETKKENFWFVGIQYNFGVQEILRKNFEYKLGTDSGKMNLVNYGSGFQTNFGFRFLISKTK